MGKNELSGNLMAGKAVCEILQKHYLLPASEKEKFLKTPEAVFLMEKLPERVANLLRKGFLDGLTGDNISEWSEVVRDFRDSRAMFKLSENPGTSFATDLMYSFVKTQDPIEEYFLMSKAGGISLRGRFDAVVDKTEELIKDVLSRQSNCLLADFGSGAGTTAMELIRKMPDYRSRIKIDCIDNDLKSLTIGGEACAKGGYKEIGFVNSDMAKLRNFYKDDNVLDLGLLIGVLCGMEYRRRVLLLKTLKRYFKPGGRIIAAALLEKMAEDDLLSAYILRETTGWQLQYRRLGELKAAFEEAGWKYLGYFQEEPTRFYEIGIGQA